MINTTNRAQAGGERLRSLASLCAVIAINFFTFLPVSVYAGPGAHGPDGQHLDGPANIGGAAGATPRVEAKTDLFELVGKLGGGEFSILIDRFSTNEPLLNAKVEVEAGTLKAQAKFHDDIGDYAIEDPAFLKAISLPGSHPLVFTVVSGDETDLLDGTLTVGPADDDKSHAHGQAVFGMSRPVAIGVGAFAILSLGGLYFFSRIKRRSSRTYAGSR